MVNLVRSAKYGNDWTQHELRAYNINITFQDAQTFFDETPLPAPSGPPEFLTALDAEDAADADSHFLITQLDLAMLPTEPEEAAVDDFAANLLRFLGYAQRARGIRSQRVTVHDLRRVQRITLWREYRPIWSACRWAIAAFQDNNTRRLAAGRPPLDSQVIPGIIMVGKASSFFKIPVTQTLSQCVEYGEYPPAPTIVTGHVPDLPRPSYRFSEGMKPLDNRRAILECYEAFKKRFIRVVYNLFYSASH
ncbi:hypothetical protein JOM56_001822 [Amanita muscaria]